MDIAKRAEIGHRVFGYCVDNDLIEETFGDQKLIEQGIVDVVADLMHAACQMTGSVSAPYSYIIEAANHYMQERAGVEV